MQRKRVQRCMDGNASIFRNKSSGSFGEWGECDPIATVAMAAKCVVGPFLVKLNIPPLSATNTRPGFERAREKTILPPE